MLDPWIIEEILKREDERRREEERGHIELPMEQYREDKLPTVTPSEPREETGRGVMIIDI